jgi:hypothetical protein
VSIPMSTAKPTQCLLCCRAADTSSLVLDTLPWLHAAAVGNAAMLADRKVKFAPDMDGYALPNALHWLLLPLSKRTVRLCEHVHRGIPNLFVACGHQACFSWGRWK